VGKTEDFDVIIIGSGAAGLVCGCYLQRSGLKVAIFENREEAGGGRMAHEAMRPGYLAQSCIWGDFEPLMPYQLDLELDRHGYQDAHMMADWGWGYIFEDNTCIVNNCWDPSKTAAKVARFSKHDADKLMQMVGYMMQPYDGTTSRFLKFMELFFTAPWTWENFQILMDIVGPLFPFADPYELTDLNGFEILDRMWESDQFKVYCASIAMGGALYPHHTGGSGMLSSLLPLGVFYSHPKHGCHNMAHVLIRCFRSMGGKLFNSSAVKKIIVSGGEAKGVILDDDAAFPGREVTSKMVVTNINPRVTFTEMIDEEHVDKKTIQQLKTNWKGEGVLVTISYAVKERPHFAAEKFDPDIVHSLTGMFGPNTMDELMREWGLRVGGRVPMNSPKTYCLPHLDDPSQTSKDNAVANIYIEVPYAINERGGEGAWDQKDFRDWIHGFVLDKWEHYSPGFKKNMMTSWMTTPLDHQRINPNYTRGCMTGGSQAAHQMFFANRADGMAGFDKGGIVTPIKNLYSSGSVGPSWSSGGNGYRAATHITEALGIRQKQTWWKHQVFEYLTQKYIQKSYVPTKTSSILDK
jgi:phytoene dehydrogenase-like protein